MTSALPCAGALALCVTLLCAAPARADSSTEFHFASTPSSPDDVYLWPANLHIGYGYTGDSNRGASAFAIGLDVLTFTYRSLLVDVATARVAFRNGCAHERPNCGVGADFFIGTRVAYAGYRGARRQHQLLAGASLGWGQVGGGFSGRPGTGDGQLVMAPSVRYAYRGLAGIELAVLLPLTGPFGERYPMALMLNVVGAGTVLVAVAAR